GEMHVYVDLLVDVRGQLHPLEPRSHEAHGGNPALLHAFFEQASELELAFSGYDRGLRREQVTASLRDCQSIHEPDFALLFRPAHAELRHTQVTRDAFGVDLDPLAFAVLHHLPRDLAAHAGDLPLQRADAALLRVVVDDRTNGPLRDIHRHVFETALLPLPR